MTNKIPKKLIITMREIKDMSDAIEMAIEGDYIPSDSRLDDFSISQEILTLSEVLKYDDYSSWGEFKKGELKDLSDKELLKVLTSYRGKNWAEKALNWIKEETFSPIIVFSKLGIIGDGRGRVNIAVGMNWKKIPVIFLS
jgi:hypothetical protein